MSDNGGATARRLVADEREMRDVLASIRRLMTEVGPAGSVEGLGAWDGPGDGAAGAPPDPDAALSAYPLLDADDEIDVDALADELLREAAALADAEAAMSTPDVEASAPARIPAPPRDEPPLFLGSETAATSTDWSELDALLSFAQSALDAAPPQPAPTGAVAENDVARTAPPQSVRPNRQAPLTERVPPPPRGGGLAPIPDHAPDSAPSAAAPPAAGLVESELATVPAPAPASSESGFGCSDLETPAVLSGRDALPQDDLPQDDLPQDAADGDGRDVGAAPTDASAGGGAAPASRPHLSGGAADEGSQPASPPLRREAPLKAALEAAAAAAAKATSEAARDLVSVQRSALATAEAPPAASPEPALAPPTAQVAADGAPTVARESAPPSAALGSAAPGSAESAAPAAASDDTRPARSDAFVDPRNAPSGKSQKMMKLIAERVRKTVQKRLEDGVSTYAGVDPDPAVQRKIGYGEAPVATSGAPAAPSTGGEGRSVAELAGGAAPTATDLARRALERDEGDDAVGDTAPPPVSVGEVDADAPAPAPAGPQADAEADVHADAGDGADAAGLLTGESRAAASRSLQALGAALSAAEGAAASGLRAQAEGALKPMLAAWLNDNLPQLVEELVREEIEQLSKKTI